MTSETREARRTVRLLVEAAGLLLVEAAGLAWEARLPEWRRVALLQTAGWLEAYARRLRQSGRPPGRATG